MQKHGLEQFEYDREGVHILLKKAATVMPLSSRPRRFRCPVACADSLCRSRDLAAPAAPHRRPPACRRSVAAAKSKAAEDLHVVKSPIVGTFYSAPSPEAEPFVTVGARVENRTGALHRGSDEADERNRSRRSGGSGEDFPENGSPVEYGESLFGIRPDRKK